MFLFFALLPMFFLPQVAAHNFLSLSFTFPFYFLHHYTLPAAGLVNHTRRWAAAFFFYLPELRPPSTHPYLSFLYGSAVISIHRRELFIYIKGTGFFSSSSSTVPNFRTKTKKKRVAGRPWRENLSQHVSTDRGIVVVHHRSTHPFTHILNIYRATI